MADLRTWSKELVTELLSLYKSFPCLWKIKSEDYRNKNLKDEAYNILVGFCKEKGFPNANRDFVVKKLQSLRGSFRKELKKASDFHRSGKGTDGVYKSSLWYYDQLLFTKDQELPTESLSYSDEDPEDEIENKADVERNIIFINEGGILESGVSEIRQQFQCGGIDAAPTERASTTQQRNKRKAANNYEYPVEFCAGADNSKSNCKELSEFDIAGMNMAKKLAKMDPIQAIYAESIINNVLSKGLLRKLTEDSDLCSCHKNFRTPTSVDQQSTSSYLSQSSRIPKSERN